MATKRPTKRTKRKLTWTEEEFADILEARIDYAEESRGLNKRFMDMECVKRAKDEFPKEYYPDKILSKAVARGMEERQIDREDFEGGISVTASEGQREALDRDMLQTALEKRFDDADEIAAIIEEGTVRTPFTQVRVNFPRASASKKKTRLRK